MELLYHRKGFCPKYRQFFQVGNTDPLQQPFHWDTAHRLAHNLHLPRGGAHLSVGQNVSGDQVSQRRTSGERSICPNKP